MMVDEYKAMLVVKKTGSIDSIAPKLVATFVRRGWIDDLVENQPVTITIKGEIELERMDGYTEKKPDWVKKVR